MNNTREQLAERRVVLMAKADIQRMQLAQAFAPLHAPLTIADKGLHALRFLVQHPVLMAGAVALAVVARPKRWLFVLKNDWLAWRMATAARRRLES